MGQYYKAVLLSTDGKVIGYLQPWTWGSLGKLMEHSWTRDQFLTNVLALLTPGSAFGDGAGVRLVWAGDYADEDYAADPEGTTLVTLYQACKTVQESCDAVPEGVRVTQFPYLVNSTKRVYVKCPAKGLHPLPILTAEGNGRGGGDLPADHAWSGLAGSWARDAICVRPSPPEAEAAYTELIMPPTPDSH
jgi:hypothetical protein